MITFDVFYEALLDCSGEKMRMIPKCDFHNHAGRGGSISYLERKFNIAISPFKGVFDTIQQMDMWFDKNIKEKLPKGIENYYSRIEANFVSAELDNIVYLSLDFGLLEVFALGGMESFIENVESLKRKFAPNTFLEPVLVIRQLEGLEYLDYIFSYNWFKSLDIINYSNSIPFEVLKIVCSYAKKRGIKCKAHIGEYGNPTEVLKYVRDLGLDEVQHGIRVIESDVILEQLKKSNVIFNVCPTSNVKLGLCSGYRNHPVGKMKKNGLNVTINTDDQLIFNTTVSDEYIRIFASGILSEIELYDIYRKSMKYAKESIWKDGK